MELPLLTSSPSLPCFMHDRVKTLILPSLPVGLPQQSSGEPLPLYLYLCDGLSLEVIT